MEERLIVEHFGPISKVDVIIRPITVFIGTQGSGKSTISKLLTIFRDIQWRLDLLNEEEELFQPFRKFNIHHFFKENTILHYYSEDGFTASYTNGHFYTGPFLNKESISYYYKQLIEDETRSFLHRAGLGDVPKEQLTASQLRLLQANSRITLYIPAERIFAGVFSDSLASMMLAKIPISEPLLEFVSLYERAKRFIPDYNVSFLGISFKHQSEEDTIISKDGVSIPFSAASSGIQSSLPMLMAIDYGFRAECFNSFVIEEPELNLYPSNQRELLHFLLSQHLNNNSGKIIITTHSPYLLSCLNVSLLAYKVKTHLSSMTSGDRLLEYAIPSDSMAVYSLDPSKDDNATSMINKKTGLIGVNGLDSVSEYISDDFQKLLSLYKSSITNK